ncbi:hypothetical protein DH2020_048144 [Rehmannia glutinosa]|uniref:DUF7804 domain-containing protein n=1 Tax=Rehmannia glutinosa TaxID=99300 RepID=A0ABR0U6L2_REHGL
MDHHSSLFNVSSKKASLLHHIGDLDSPTSTHHIRPIDPEEEESMKEEDEEINSKKLDQWVRDSAVEIVNNLGEAPFLVHIYCDGNGSNRDGSTRIKMIKEKAIADNWPMIEGRWKRGSGAAPDGVILVEELKTPLVKAKTSDDEMVKTSGLNYQSCSSTKLWGILIQGKRKSCTACYLLKTSQVECVAGLCTHFCLLRVECFLEHADIQLKKLWLQNADGLIST